MPQTDPRHFLMPRKLADRELAQAIRLDLEAELDAINLYESHMLATDNELAKRVLAHVANEEREHAELFRQLLVRLDPELAPRAEAAPRQLGLMEAGASDEEVERAGADGAKADGEARSGGLLTVGSLRGLPEP